MRMLMVEGGNLEEGCEKCWKANNYEGKPPYQLAMTEHQASDANMVDKMMKLNTVKTREQKEEEEREKRRIRKMEVVKGKDPIKKAFQAMIRHIRKKNLSDVELFNEIDDNGDGILTRGEMSAALRRLGCKLHPAELDAICRMFDVDNSGSVDFAEFYSVLKREEKEIAAMDAAEADPRMLGWEVGERVRLKIKLFPDMMLYSSMNDDNLDALETAEVMGPGATMGTLIAYVHRTKEMLTVKPQQIIRFKPDVLAHKTTCMCNACLQLEEESDDD